MPLGRSRRGFGVGAVELDVDVAPASTFPCVQLVAEPIEAAKGALDVWILIARPVVNRGVLVAVDCGIEPVDQALDFFPGGPASSHKRLEEVFGGYVGSTI